MISHKNAQLPRDFDTTHSTPSRRFNRTYGLLPPAVESSSTQISRCLEQLKRREKDIDKFIYLSQLRSANVHLFYRLLSDHLKQVAPLIYTPTVGEACIQWSHNYIQPEGLYLSYADRGRVASVLNNWPERNVEITVMTDGSRILGLGDLGVNGMGIPVGKLALYTSCAGIRPEATLPLMLDCGTGNQKLIDDPFYLGSKQARISEADELAFMDEVMKALNEKWPGILVQFEDFKNPFPALEKYGPRYTCFNDDIQGTGAVVLAGIVNALKQSHVSLHDHKAVFFGAGSAGVGVAKQIVQYFISQGMTEDQARSKFWFVDSRGMVTGDRGDAMPDHKKYFARTDNDGKQYHSLEEVADLVKPSILMGLSTMGGAFTPNILTKMAQWSERPIIFPLSNPSANSECTFAEAIKYTNGKALFASGSPFHPVTHDGHEISPGQGNNMYIFPGVGLGAILSKATVVTQSMIYASGLALSESLTEHEKGNGWLYPEVARIRDVSVIVAKGVIKAADEAGVSRETHIRSYNDEELESWIRSRMYDPHKETARLENELRELMH